MKRILAPVLLLSFLFPLFAQGETEMSEEEILLVCQMSKIEEDKSYFVVNPQLRVAKFMNPDTVVLGKLTTTENSYAAMD